MPNPQVRILFVISDLAGGGAERVVSTTLRYLDRARFLPGLCLWRRDRRTYPIPEDVPVWILEKAKWWHLPKAIRRTAGLLRRWRPEVVCSHLPWVNLTTGLAIRLASWRGAWFPFCHNVPQQELPGWLRGVYREALRGAHEIVGVSRGVRDAHLRLIRYPKRNVVACYNPVDFSVIDAALGGWDGRRSEKPTVMGMGRLTPQKDHATLLRAFARVRHSADAELVILGTGPLQGSLEALAEKLGVREHVRFPGFQPDPFALLARGHVFVLSSKWEGLGLALIEAMAAGVPSVSTRCPHGPDEIIQDGTSGLLVGVGDADAMAGAILRILTDAELAGRLSANGNRRVRSLFDPRRNVLLLEERLLAGAARHGKSGTVTVSEPACRQAGRKQ